MVKNSSTLAKRLIQARSAAGMTQGDVAQAIGITQPSYSSLERGVSKRTNYIGSLAHVLGVDAYWLETGAGQMRKLGVAEQLAEYAMPTEKRRILHALDKMSVRKRKALLELLSE